MTLQNNVSELILQKLAQTTNLEKAGLLDGLAGESVYYFYRSEVLEDEAAYEKAILKLQQTIEVLSSTQANTTFYNGLAGIGWLICHLNETEIAEIAVEDFLDTSVDAFLYEEMLQFLNTRVYDFFYGAAGICFYFLKRYVTTQNQAVKETYKTYITHFLFYLEYTRIKDSNGTHWKSHPLPFEADEEAYQLSGTHNSSGLMLVLTEIAKTQDFNPICRPLLAKSSAWLAYKLQTVDNIPIDEAFCLWKAASVLEDAALAEKGIHHLKETTTHLTEVKITSLSKLALIYQKVGLETNETFFIEKATECFQIITKKLPEQELATASIWNGYAGIGLAELSLKSQQSLAWSNCMLI